MIKVSALFAVLAVATISNAQFNLSLNKSAVAGQNFVQGTVTLDAVAASDTVFTTYDNSSLVSTPPSVTVVTGTLSRTFQMSVTAVNSTINTTVYARLGAVTKSQPLALTPLVPTALAFSPTLITGGGVILGRVVINGVAGPGGRVISIYDNSNYSEMPSTVTVPPGGTDVFFNITTQRPPSIQTVTVTARVSAGAKAGTFRISPSGFARMIRFDSVNDGIRLTGGTYAGACDLRQNFTVEAIVRPTSLTTSVIWQQWQNGGMNEALIIQPTNFFFTGTGAGTPPTKYYGNQLSLNTWAHLAWVYDGATVRVYRNGQLESTTNRSGSICPLSVAQAASIGKNSAVPYTSDPSFFGDLAAFRISRVPRYAGTSFAPPTAPWADDADTLALLDPSTLVSLPVQFPLPGTAGLLANPGQGSGNATAPTLLNYTS